MANRIGKVPPVGMANRHHGFMHEESHGRGAIAPIRDSADDTAKPRIETPRVHGWRGYAHCL
jgi:hypothetical protein